MTEQRKSVKILGAIELFQTRFHYRQETVFNASTYLTSFCCKTPFFTLDKNGSAEYPGF